MRETTAKGKDMGPRYAGTTDLVRVFNRALELLNSTTPESDQELLELVKKSKREMEKEQSVPPAKKEQSVAPAKKARMSLLFISQTIRAEHKETDLSQTAVKYSGMFMFCR
jgi:hypothetical protein